MAGWISSKLKVAETFLQQIDQQAADSLGKAERRQGPSDAFDLSFPDHKRAVDTAPALNLQIPKRLSSPQPSLSQSPPPLTSSTPPSLGDDGDWTTFLSSSSERLDRGTNKATISLTVSQKGIGRSGLMRDKKLTAVVEEEASQSDFLGLGQKHGEQHQTDVERVDSFGAFGKDPELVDIKDGEDIEEPSIQIRSLGLTRSSSGSEGELGSDSASTSNSEDERLQREERRHRRAQRMAAAADEAIKERKELVARLETEKQTIEKILKEQEKKQALEATELQTSMIETMEAVEIEKRRHNSTRMEALAHLAKIEAVNAELAESLATIQRSLQVEVSRVEDLHEQIELKELCHGDYRRKMCKIRKSTSLQDEIESFRSFKLEQEFSDAEYTLTCEKITELKIKAKKIVENIETTRREMMHHTEIEIELKRRLDQLSDRLIEKQLKVEALSSEKATLLLRIETASRLPDDSRLLESTVFAASGSSSKIDIEAGTQHVSHSGRSTMYDKVRTRQLQSVIQQTAAIFSVGLVHLRRNPKLQMLSLVYLVCLHMWVLYIMLHSEVLEATSSGAVISLKSINSTGS